ncbi:aldo/keto reductase [Myxococcota bacterium]|nr:aldo/keto reductase [Myxococcota bacterium]
MLIEGKERADRLSRRRFMQGLMALGIAGRTLWASADARAAIDAGKEALNPSTWPAMTYTTLGRTQFRASRLVMGCGASLMIRGREELLETAFAAGVNVYDVGYRGYYRWAERNLASFLKRRRDKIFLISKAVAEVEVEPDVQVTPDQAQEAARIWSRRLDQSLQDLQVDSVDAYYLMACDNPSLLQSEEILRAFEVAREAGKVKHLGISTHRNADRVLEAAVETGRYDLAMIAITPGGWYDWETKSILKGSPTMEKLQPKLEAARAAGIALVGMKAARHLSGLPVLGWWKKLDAFNAYYPEPLMQARLSPFQRSYAFVLAHGLDVVNADIQDPSQLRENLIAAATSAQYFS